jgi:tetratricopeptide (TPR) repeat protein
MSYLVEWQPPVWHEQPFFFFLLGLVWLLMLLTYRKIKLADLLPVLAFSYMAVTSYRNIPLFLIAGLPVLAGHGQDFFRALFPKMRPQPGRRPWPLLAGTAALLGILALAATQGYAFRLGEIEAFYPADGLAWLSQQPWEGRLLTHDIWGGFTGWTTHNRYKVFMDGRMPTFGPLLYADYRKIIWGDAEQCLPLLDRYQIEGILVSPKNELRLYMQLWQSGAWALIYWDDVCLLYVRRGGANQKLIDRYEYRYVDPKRTPYFNPSHPEMALPEIERAQKTAPRSYLPWFFLGESWMRANQPDQAERAFQQTLRLAPGHVGTHYNLGLIAQQRRQFPAAENHFLIAFRYAESQEIAGKVAYLLAANLQQQGRLREACDWAQKACQGLPNWEPAKQMAQALENQLLQGGMKK